MTGKTADSRRRASLANELGARGQTMPPARGRPDLAEAGDDHVRILMKLTGDVERFDSMVVLQRKLLEQRTANAGALDNDQLDRQSERLTREAAVMVASARQALDELRRLSEATKPSSPQRPPLGRGRGLAKDRHADPGPGRTASASPRRATP